MVKEEDLTCLYCGGIIYNIPDVVRETFKRKGLILADEKRVKWINT